MILIHCLLPSPSQPCDEKLARIKENPTNLAAANLTASEFAFVQEMCLRLDAEKGDKGNEVLAAGEFPALPAATGPSFLEFQEEQAEWSAPVTHGTPPAPRGGHCAHFSLQTLYIFGGCTVGPRSRCYNDVSSLDTRSLTWSRVHASGSAPHPAARVACASAGSNLAVFGGYAGTYLNAVHFFDSEMKIWTRAQPAGAPPKGRQGATLTRVSNNYILVGGADDAVHYNDVHVLSLDGKSWTSPPARCAPAPCALPPPREGHSAALVGSKLWIYGGVGRTGSRGPYQSLTSLVYLDVSTYTWHDPEMHMRATELSLTGRSLHAAVSLGSRFMLLGGLTTPQRKVLSDAAIVDTETFTWTRPLPVGAAPPGRSGLSASLNGRTVFVFGGCGESACTDELLSFRFQYKRRQSSDGSKLAALAGPHPRRAPHLHRWVPQPVLVARQVLAAALLLRPRLGGARLLDRRAVRLQRPRRLPPTGAASAIRASTDSNVSTRPCARTTARGTGSACTAAVTATRAIRGATARRWCSARSAAPIAASVSTACASAARARRAAGARRCSHAQREASAGRRSARVVASATSPGASARPATRATRVRSRCRAPTTAGTAGGVRRGKCEYGQCWCDPGSPGRTARRLRQCPNDCSHRGVCFRDRCECEPGYGGADCSESLFECARNCSGHGALPAGRMLLRAWLEGRGVRGQHPVPARLLAPRRLPLGAVPVQRGLRRRRLPRRAHHLRERLLAPRRVREGRVLLRARLVRCRLFRAAPMPQRLPRQRAV